MDINKSESDVRVLGIDIGGTSVKMGILARDADADANTDADVDACTDTGAPAGIVDVRQVDMITNAPEIMVEKIAALANTYDVDIVGVGSAGAVNHKTGLVSAGNLKWRDVPLRAMLAEKLQKPVWVDNDAKAALMAEWYSGVCKGLRCAVCVTLGTGLGGGLLIDGKPWRGDDNTAFELGQIITRGDEYVNTGTKEGRYEYYASGIGLSRMYDGRLAREVVEGVLAGDARCRSIFDWFIHELALGLVTVVMLFRPEVIALGGGLSAAGDYLLTGIRSEMAKLMSGRSGSFSGELLQLAVHGNNAGMIGAAALAKMYLLKGDRS
jgi:glucokinase